jgi:ABC-type lipoprotein export system ATPase subunit
VPSGAQSDLVALERVTRRYDDGRVTALLDVTLRVGSGEFIAIIGPSGSGKSTLLHLACGLDRPTAGRVVFEGVVPASGRAWARLRAERVGIVFQAFNLLPTLTAAENVEVPMFGIQASARARRARALDLLARVGLDGRTQHRPGELSGGERQRLAIARCLANGPRLILADEPTGNLDTQTSAEILDLLEEVHRREAAALVVVTHEPAIAARAHRVVRLIDGRVAGIATGPTRGGA